MNQFERFQDAINLENTEDNKFVVNPNTNYFVGNTPHGGYLMALMHNCLLYTSPSPRDVEESRMPSSA